MEQEDKPASEPESQFSNDQVNLFLKTIGLVQPIDYIFLDYAMTENRKRVEKSTQPLQFLFHVVMASADDNRPFPYSSFLELVNQRKIKNVTEDSTSDFVTLQRYVIYNFCPSDTWTTRPVAPFTDFHLYFLDVLKPMVPHSAEELYQLFDLKRGETFFLTFGDHSVNDFMSVLFVTKKLIAVFHIPRLEPINEEEYSYPCKWIHTSIPTISRPIHEYAIFELPDTNLVLTEEGVEQKRVQWQEAFGNPDLMDQELDDGEEMKSNNLAVSNEEDQCLSCGS